MFVQLISITTKWWKWSSDPATDKICDVIFRPRKFIKFIWGGKS